MKRDAMNRQLAAELRTIPRGGPEQNDLRMTYSMARRASLGGNPEVPRTARDVLDYSIAKVQKWHPGAQLQYDREALPDERERSDRAAGSAV